MPTANNSRRTRRRNNRRASSVLSLSTPTPIMFPDFPANPTLFTRARFSGNVQPGSPANSEAIITVTGLNLLEAAAGILATGSTLGYVVAQACRIKRVKAQVSPVTDISNTSITSATTIGISWYDSSGRSSGQNHSSTSLSSTAPASIISRPPANSFCSMWIAQPNNTEGYFDIIVSTGNGSGYLFVMIEIELDWVQSNQAYLAISQSTSLTMTTGNVYYPPLDGVSSHILSRLNLPIIY